MASFKLYARERKDAKGRVIIYLRISHKAKRVFINTGIKVHARHWNENTSSVRRSHKEHKEIADRLIGITQTCNTVLIDMTRRGDVISAERLKIEIEKALSASPGSADFIEYGRELIKGYREEGRIATWKSMRVVLNKLEAYQSPVYFGDLTPEFLRKFKTHLHVQHGNKINTVAKNLDKIRTILYAAIREGKYPQDRNPFFHIKIEHEDTVKTHLRPEEVDAMLALKLKEGQGPFLARDYFMFAFYMFGIRFSDVALFSNDHISIVGGKKKATWIMGKTNRRHSVVITKPAQEILARYKDRGGGEYIFPILDGYDLSTPEKMLSSIGSRNTKINKDLRKVASRAGVKTHISFHISRHSISGYLLTKGWSMHDISKALGHKTLRQTETYFKGFDFGYLDDKMDNLWD